MHVPPTWSDDPLRDHPVAFVGGLHRSGTTPIARWLAQHPDVSAFERTGVYEDEGQHLQTVFPTARTHGGPGRFAFDPDARMTAASPLVSEASRRRLLGDWLPYWDLDKRVLLEKSPPNLLRMGFLHALFPQARFIVVIRHPVAVAYATQKWSRTPLHSLLRHWNLAYERARVDAATLPHVRVVRYEDVMRDPAASMSELFAFLDLSPFDGDWAVTPGLNERYLARWRPRGNPYKLARNAIACHRFEAAVNAYGYTLRPPWVIAPVDSVPGSATAAV